MGELQQNLDINEKLLKTIDVVIVGAGFSGLYMLYRLRTLGISARIFEVADGVGGTWYWNRYPGARCDIESMQYSYSFNDELQQEWNWTERYASQPEILRYLNYVADKFDLRKDIQFKTCVTAAIFDETLSRWHIHTNTGDHISAKFCIMATGCLSKPKNPEIRGMDTFKGTIYSTCQWPHEDIKFNNRHVAVIGTGSSGIQSIPIIAEQAAHLYIFQRTPNFSIPGYNAPMDPKEEQLWKANYNEYRRDALQTMAGFKVNGLIHDKSVLSVSPEEQLQAYETRWLIGGLTFLATFNDIRTNKEANDTAADFIRSKIRQTVKDPIVAETLIPQDHPIGSKRLCVDNHYFETFNRDNVTLINLKKENIEEIVPDGIKTNKMIYDVDSIVFATGFDAMTGALLSIDIQGQMGYTLREKWAAGPCTYLGIMTSNFPNLFMITGPGSPSVLTNMVVSIEQHVNWIAECINYMEKNHLASIDATIEAENTWVNHVNEIANTRLYTTANSWYMGANVPGKPRVFMPYAGGIVAYHNKCKEVVANNYEGFHFKSNQLIK